MFHLDGDHLHAIHLDPACKRRDIGSRLMDEAERRAVREHTEARLEVLAFNTGAMTFYERRGWVRARPCMLDERGEAVAGFEMRKSFSR